MTDVTPLRKVEIPTSPLAAETFGPYGRVLAAGIDGPGMSEAEGALDLSQGTPRFYVMQLLRPKSTFTGITRHRRVTQCLAAAGGLPWWLAVAAPAAGQSAATDPAVEDIVGFVVPGDVAVLLHRGTWHAGPFFEGETMAFFNLELAGTNVEDHDTSHLDRRLGVECFFGTFTGPSI